MLNKNSLVFVKKKKYLSILNKITTIICRYCHLQYYLFDNGTGSHWCI